ncbi:hypothetical protein C8R47DRAFT_724601 [Mycena vitilis]|nr:hypothetical protein C8R47DRAFT_724601 [Mycena vitilis]
MSSLLYILCRHAFNVLVLTLTSNPTGPFAVKANSTSTRRKFKHQLSTRIVLLEALVLGPNIRSACIYSSFEFKLQLNSDSNPSRELSGLDAAFNHSDILFCFVQRYFCISRSQDLEPARSASSRTSPPRLRSIHSHPPSTIRHPPSAIQPSTSNPHPRNPTPPARSSQPSTLVLHPYRRGIEGFGGDWNRSWSGSWSWRLRGGVELGGEVSIHLSGRPTCELFDSSRKFGTQERCIQVCS